MERLLDGEVRHAPGKGVEVQEIQDPTKKSHFVKEMSFSSKGMIPLDRLKEFIEGTITDKCEVSTKSSHMYAKSYTRKLITSTCMLVINLRSFNDSRAKEIQSNMFHTLWKHLIMMGPMEITLSSNFSAL